MLSRYEAAINEQMDVIEKLTDEKAKINAELMGAVNLIKQLKRENAALAFQVNALPFSLPY